jgi:hypothetical protein
MLSTGVAMMIDWHISIGTIIEVLAILGGGLFFLWGMKTRVAQINKTIDELRHGVGFIKTPISIVG